MIIDCHSHIWSSREVLGLAAEFSCLTGAQTVDATVERHREACEPAEVAFVLGFVSNLLNAKISNGAIKRYAADHSGRVIAFAGIDPTEKKCCEKIRAFHDEGCFSGLTVSPACQGFHPADSRAMIVYGLAEELELPVYFLQGEILPAVTNLSFAQPVALDEVARTFPQLKIIISHLGHPWVDQTIALLGKHLNVFSDVAGITDKPWQAYRTLSLAYEYNVMDKLLFGSDFPNQTVTTAVESLYNLNKLTIDSVLPAIPREQLRGIVERDSLAVLGLGS